MSANNKLIIEKSGDKFYVNDVDVDGGGGIRIRDEGFDSYRDAIKAGNEYMRDHTVEYGMTVDENYL